MEKKREEKVHADLLAMDANRASEKSNEYASKLKNQYGPQDSSTKLSVTVKKSRKRVVLSQTLQRKGSGMKYLTL